jgi:Glycosyltransferase family 10 (fucosyltransferase) C-term
MKKIRLTCNWKSIPNDEILVKLFNSSFITKNNFNENYTFTHKDQFDYLVILNALRDEKLNKYINPSKTIINYMEPSWHSYVQEGCNSNLFKAKWVLYHKPKLLQKYYNIDIKNIDVNFKKIPGLLPHSIQNLDFHLNNKYVKTKKCSLILSMKMNADKPAIYKERLMILSKILNSDLDIDIYGEGLDKIKNKDSRIKGRLKFKLDGLKDYQFSIGMENTIEDGYFTEKLTDCILTDATPIYLGCKDINNYFDNIHSMSLDQDPVKYITNILDNNLILDQTENKKLFEYKYNFYTQVINLIEENNI